MQFQHFTPKSGIQSSHAQIADAATQFLNGLTDEQRTTATYAITDPEYLRWHWTTTRTFPRNGLALRHMAANQQEATYALLRTSISQAGFQKSMDIMALQPEIGGDPLNYYVTIFGAPGDPTWGWRFEGHHLSRRFTMAGDKITITPFFHGVWPTVSEAGKVIMQREEWAARELVRLLITFKGQPSSSNMTTRATAAPISIASGASLTRILGRGW